MRWHVVPARREYRVVFRAAVCPGETREGARVIPSAAGRGRAARKIDRRALRNDAGRVHALDRVVVDDVVARLHRRGDARHVVELEHVVLQVRIVGDALLVALEDREIGDVEAQQRREQPPVGLGDLLADQIALLGQPRLQLVERGEQPVVGRLVGVLRLGEAGAIDAVVDVEIGLLVDAVDLGAQLLRIVVGVVAADRIELAVEHPDDLGQLVVDDRLGLLVPQRRHRDLAGVFRIGRGIGLMQIVEAVDGVRRAVRKFRVVRETPSPAGAGPAPNRRR